MLCALLPAVPPSTTKGGSSFVVRVGGIRVPVVSAEAVRDVEMGDGCVGGGVPRRSQGRGDPGPFVGAPGRARRKCGEVKVFSLVESEL
jgi:hypothetical protein